MTSINKCKIKMKKKQKKNKNKYDQIHKESSMKSIQIWQSLKDCSQNSLPL